MLFLSGSSLDMKANHLPLAVKCAADPVVVLVLVLVAETAPGL